MLLRNLAQKRIAGSDWFVALIYAAAIGALAVLTLTKPLPILLDRFIPDDTFYYLNPARIFAQTGFSSFDGLHFTNGYQPLWFLTIVPVFWLFPHGGEVPLRLVLWAQVPLSIVATVLMIRTIARSFGAMLAGIAAVVWIVIFQRVMLNGLESALQMALYALVADLFATLYVHAAAPATPRRLAWLGIVCGLLFLARTDSIFLLAALGLFLLGRAWRRGATGWQFDWRPLLAWAIPVAVIAGGYLFGNLLTTGHLMPVSGAAKQFYSSQARGWVIASGVSPWRVYLDNLTWPFREPGYRFVGAFLATAGVLVAAAFFPPFKANWGAAQRFWPFYAAMLGVFLYYSIVFYGGYTRTIWYYGPAVYWGGFALAGFGSILKSGFPFRVIPGLAPVLLVGLVMDWLPLFDVLVLVILAIVVSLAVRNRAPVTGPWHWGVLLTITVAALGLVVARGISLQTWAWITTGCMLLGAFLLRDAMAGRAWLMQSVFVVVGMSGAVHGVNLMSDLGAQPGNWNYNLYLGATWARDHLPHNATIWSGSAGILGYFSEDTVVSTDGLANSYDFLEHVLKAGRLAEYEAQWDYGIDAFAGEDLAKWVPGGCFVPLPDDVTRHPFADGALTRRLSVFQMKPSGIVQCGVGK